MRRSHLSLRKKGRNMQDGDLRSVSSDCSSQSRQPFTDFLAGGMYRWMAMATFVIFGHELKTTSAVFWFMMQIAMWFGFATSFPVKWLLLTKRIKEPM